jgi:hypothetical protein
MKKFFVKVGDTMQKNVKSKLEEQINTILKASDYSEQEIETFFLEARKKYAWIIEFQIAYTHCSPNIFSALVFLRVEPRWNEE